MDDLLDERGAAAFLGVAPQTLRHWRAHARRPLPFVRIGRAIRYRRADLAAFVEAQRVIPNAMG